MTRLPGLLLLGTVLLAFALPATAPPAAAADPSASDRRQEQREALRSGLELYRAGRAEQALPLLRGFIVRHPDDPGVPAALLAVSRIFLERQLPREALLYLERLPPAAAEAPEARLLQGLARVGAGEPEAGRALLLNVSPEALDPGDRRQRLQGLAVASAALDRRLEALVFLHLALPLATDPDDLLALGHEYLQGLEAAGLAEAAFMFAATPLGADARLVQAQRAERRGDLATARRLGEELVAGSVSFPYRRQAVRLYERLTGATWQQPAVGVLLPLSGRYAAFGNLVRRGIELAVRAAPDAAIRFVYRDTGAEAEVAAGGVEALLFEDGVMAVAGPITGAAAHAAALRAQREGVPLLTLSQREGLPEIGNQVFRNSLTPRLQARTLARHAVEERGLTRFAILHPDNRLGQEMAALFTAELAFLGGEVTARQGYAETATDFRRQVRLLMGKDPDAPDEEEIPVDPLEALFLPDEPDLPFEALFIPDYADKIGLIAPQLPFYGLEDLPLFGINGWNSPELVRQVGPYVEGAVFPDGFFVASPEPRVAAFVSAYRERFGEDPTILEAQGYDVAGILLRILADPGVRDREDVRRALQRLRDYPGVTGTTSFTLDGEADKTLFLLQVQDGRIVQIN